MKAGGRVLTFDQLALQAPKGEKTVLLQGLLFLVGFIVSNKFFFF